MLYLTVSPVIKNLKPMTYEKMLSKKALEAFEQTTDEA
jgi:hypothetical protein